MRSIALLYTLSFLVAAAPQQGASPDGNGALSAESPDVRSIFGMDNLQFNAPKAPSVGDTLSQPSNIILTVDTPPAAPKEPTPPPSQPPTPVDIGNSAADRVIVGDPCTGRSDIQCGFISTGSNDAATPNAGAPDAAIVSTNTPPPLVASNDGATSEPRSPVSNGNFNQFASPLSNPPPSSILQQAEARPLTVDNIGSTGNDAPDTRNRLDQRLNLASTPLLSNFAVPGQPQTPLMFTGLNGPDTSAAPNGVSVGTTPAGNVMSSTGENGSPPANGGQTPPGLPLGSRTFTSPLTAPQSGSADQPGSSSVQTTPEQSVPSSQGMQEPPTNFSDPPPQGSFGPTDDQTLPPPPTTQDLPPTAPATNSVGSGPVPFIDGPAGGPVNDPPTLLSGPSDNPSTVSDGTSGERGFNPLFNPTNLGPANTPNNANTQLPPNFGAGAPFQFPGDNNGNGMPAQRGMPGGNGDRRNTMLVSPISTPQSTTPSDGSASTVVTNPADSNVFAGAMPSSFGGRPSMGQFGSSNGEGSFGQFPRPRFGQRRPDENMPWIGENGQFRQLPSGGNAGPGQRNMQMMPPQQLPRGGPPATPVRTPWSPQVFNKWTGEQSRYFENGLQSGPSGPQVPSSWRTASDSYFEPLPARPAN